jgi:hypothetical protein
MAFAFLPRHIVHTILERADLDIDTRLALRLPARRLTLNDSHLLTQRLRSLCTRRARWCAGPNKYMVPDGGTAQRLDCVGYRRNDRTYIEMDVWDARGETIFVIRILYKPRSGCRVMRHLTVANVRDGVILETATEPS